MSASTTKILLWRSALTWVGRWSCTRGLSSAVTAVAAPSKLNLITRTATTAATELQPCDEPVHPEAVNPLRHHDYFGVRDLVTLDALFEVGAHLGHKAGLRCAHMRPYIYGTRLGVDVIDLEQSVALMGDALNFLAHIAFRRGVVLFVSRHRQMAPLVERTAMECGEYAHCRHWLGGTFTNATVQYGLVTRLPDTVVLLSTQADALAPHTALTEATKLNIPTVAVVDTASDPRLVTYPIPGNDDTPSAITLYCRLFGEAVRRGKARREEVDREGVEEGMKQ